MPNGVTTFSSKIKCSESNGRYEEVTYSPWDTASVLRANATTGIIYTQITDKSAFSTGDGSSTSNIGGMSVASAGTIDFLLRVPANYDAATTSYVDIFYFLTGAGTKGDRVAWTGAYNTASVNATTKALATAGTTTGITNPTARVLATSKSNGYVYKDSITVGPNTFTADTLPQFRITAAGGYTAPELRIAKIVHRFARTFL